MKYFKARELEIKKNILDTRIENYEMKQYLAKLKSKYSEDSDIKKLEKYKHDLYEQYKNNEQQCYKYQEGIFNKNKAILKEQKNAQNNINQLTIYFQGEAMKEMQEQIKNIEEQQRLSYQLQQDQLSLVKYSSNSIVDEDRVLIDNTQNMNNSEKQISKLDDSKLVKKSDEKLIEPEYDNYDHQVEITEFEIEFGADLSKETEDNTKENITQTVAKPSKSIDKDLLIKIVESEMNAEEIEIINNEKIDEQNRINQIKTIEQQVTVEKLRLQEELDRIRRERIYEENRIKQEAKRLEDLRILKEQKEIELQQKLQEEIDKQVEQELQIRFNEKKVAALSQK